MASGCNGGLLSLALRMLLCIFAKGNSSDVMMLVRFTHHVCCHTLPGKMHWCHKCCLSRARLARNAHCPAGNDHGHVDLNWLRLCEIVVKQSSADNQTNEYRIADRTCIYTYSVAMICYLRAFRLAHPAVPTEAHTALHAQSKSIDGKTLPSTAFCAMFTDPRSRL
jgi:hypothetical protein